MGSGYSANSHLFHVCAVGDLAMCKILIGKMKVDPQVTKKAKEQRSKEAKKQRSKEAKKQRPRNNPFFFFSLKPFSFFLLVLCFPPDLHREKVISF